MIQVFGKILDNSTIVGYYLIDDYTLKTKVVKSEDMLYIDEEMLKRLSIFNKKLEFIGGNPVFIIQKIKSYYVYDIIDKGKIITRVNWYMLANMRKEITGRYFYVNAKFTKDMRTIPIEGGEFKEIEAKFWNY